MFQANLPVRDYIYNPNTEILHRLELVVTHL